MFKFILGSDRRTGIKWGNLETQGEQNIINQIKNHATLY
jgi:hypothetical protein